MTISFFENKYLLKLQALSWGLFFALGIINTASGTTTAELALQPDFSNGANQFNLVDKQPNFSWQQQLNNFADEMAAKDSVNAAWLKQVLKQARHNAQVKRLMTPKKGLATTVKDWQAYQKRLVTLERISYGVAFWKAHEKVLLDVEIQTGVPAEVMVGIIGIETFYGRQMGNIRVLDALATLAFDYPQEHPNAQKRSNYFRKELENFLNLCKAKNLDPIVAKGSYAGAMGIAQFMPSSWILYGKSYTQADRVDLINSSADAIASVGHYLSEHGWVRGVPAFYGVELHSNAVQMEKLLQPDILPTFEAQTLSSLGATITPNNTSIESLLALVELKNGVNKSEYVLGTQNFYALTRYNQSSYYAMAVLKLGEAVASLRQ